MVGPQGNGLEVSVCDPDLRIPNIVETPTVSATAPLEAEPSLVRVRVKGVFRIEGKSEVRLEKASAGETELEFPCRHAQPVEVLLQPGGV
jgi:hypothetical protein